MPELKDQIATAQRSLKQTADDYAQLQESSTAALTELRDESRTALESKRSAIAGQAEEILSFIQIYLTGLKPCTMLKLIPSWRKKRAMQQSQPTEKTRSRQRLLCDELSKIMRMIFKKQ